jgi:hypothetical protein
MIRPYDEIVGNHLGAVADHWRDVFVVADDEVARPFASAVHPPPFRILRLAP